MSTTYDRLPAGARLARKVSRARPIRVAHITTIDLTLVYLLKGQLRRLQAEGYEVTAISAPGPAVPSLEADGIRHIPWRGATRGWSLTSDLRAFLELVRILRRERFDVVHTHNPKPGVLGRIAARIARVPCVVNTVHGLYATPTDPRARKAAVLAAEWIAARASDAELYQSEEDFGWARRIRLAGRRRTVLLGNGIDLRRFDPSAVDAATLDGLRAELGIAPGALVIGTVGRLVVEKGYRELLEVADRVHAELPEAVFLIVGGSDDDKWDAISKEEITRPRDHVIFAGHRDDVRDLLGVMDVFVLASWREGLPRGAMEAAAMARPLVLTDIRGCREVARDGIEGLLVPPKDPARLYDAVMRLARDGDLRKRMGAAARERALTRFDERRVEDIVVREYHTLLGRAGMVSEEIDDLRVRRATLADVPLLARHHVEMHPTAFMPRLGERFMRVLYRSFVTDEDAVAVIAEQNGTVIAFATGALSVDGFYRRFFRRHGIRAGIAAGHRLLRPTFVKRVVETARYPVNMKGYPEPEFLTLGVLPGVRSRGLGGLLGNVIVEELGDIGADEVRGTVASDNAAMLKMMTNSGWETIGEFSVHDGLKSVVFKKATPASRDRVTSDGDV
ncbi:MAG: glycosyltransferase [Actinomycetota bacterium]